MIAIIDYGRGNLRSVEKAFEAVGQKVIVTQDVKEIKKAKAMVIPGVGAFYGGMEALKKRELYQLIKEEVKAGKPLMGICLGMQLFFQQGFEVKKCEGFGFLKGDVLQLPQGQKIPHMGWNQLNIRGESPLLKNVKEGEYVYFVHSFYAVAGDEKVVKATANYGLKLPAVVEQENIFGLQFHPEKSGEVGLKMLQNFGRLI